VFLRESIAANSRQGKFLFQLGQYTPTFTELALHGAYPGAAIVADPTGQYDIAIYDEKGKAQGVLSRPCFAPDSTILEQYVNEMTAKMQSHPKDGHLLVLATNDASFAQLKAFFDSHQLLFDVFVIVYLPKGEGGVETRYHRFNHDRTMPT
jgi:hypothetical protein